MDLPDREAWIGFAKYVGAVLAGIGLIALWCVLWVWWNTVG